MFSISVLIKIRPIGWQQSSYATTANDRYLSRAPTNPSKYICIFSSHSSLASWEIIQSCHHRTGKDETIYARHTECAGHIFFTVIACQICLKIHQFFARWNVISRTGAMNFALIFVDKSALFELSVTFRADTVCLTWKRTNKWRQRKKIERREPTMHNEMEHARTRTRVRYSKKKRKIKFLSPDGAWYKNRNRGNWIEIHY